MHRKMIVWISVLWKMLMLLAKKMTRNDCKMANRYLLLWHSYWIRVWLAGYQHSILKKEAVWAMMDQFLAHSSFINWPDKAKTSLITSTSSSITATCCIVSKFVLQQQIEPQLNSWQFPLINYPIINILTSTSSSITTTVCAIKQWCITVIGPINRISSTIAGSCKLETKLCYSVITNQFTTNTKCFVKSKGMFYISTI